MSIDLKTLNVKPRRQTFSHIARRFGEDRTATRYEEGMLDLQATHHFHYRPLWAPEYELYDTNRTAIKLEDWYVLRDPRQFYYASYNISRSAMRQAAEHNMVFVEKRNMLDSMTPAWRSKVEDYLLPLRHVAWGANMNASQICDQGYGTAVTAPAIFTAGDQLGIAQLISQIGLMLGDGTSEVLERAKQTWMTADHWQGVRKLVEDSLVLEDWFELFVAQNLVIDGMIYPLVYEIFDGEGQKHGAAGLSMITGFMTEWFADHSRWVDAVIKVAAQESEDNQALLSAWFGTWREATATAVKPLAAHVLDEAGEAAVSDVVATLNGRAAKLGLNAG